MTMSGFTIREAPTSQQDTVTSRMHSPKPTSPYHTVVRVCECDCPYLLRAQLRDGQPFIVTDYLDSYDWLRANTPEDARVLSW